MTSANLPNDQYFDPDAYLTKYDVTPQTTAFEWGKDSQLISAPELRSEPALRAYGILLTRSPLVSLVVLCCKEHDGLRFAHAGFAPVLDMEFVLTIEVAALGGLLHCPFCSPEAPQVHPIWGPLAERLFDQGTLV